MWSETFSKWRFWWMKMCRSATGSACLTGRRSRWSCYLTLLTPWSSLKATTQTKYTSELRHRSCSDQRLAWMCLQSRTSSYNQSASPSCFQKDSQKTIWTNLPKMLARASRPWLCSRLSSQCALRGQSRSSGTCSSFCKSSVAWQSTKWVSPSTHRSWSRTSGR